MSGGSHDYIYSKINDYLCGQMMDAEINDLMEDVSKLAHDLEWYHSGDIGEKTYRKTVEDFKTKWFKEPRNKRLIKYVNEELDALKQKVNLLFTEE